MPREAFERDLQRLQDEMVALGSLVSKALIESVESLKQRDFESSRQLIAQDRTVNKQRFEIESAALILIATQQPMATDLRVVAAVLEIAGELERIGDYAKGIAKINLMIGEGPLIKPLVDLPRMAQVASSMLHRSLEAFVLRDVEMARAIPGDDDEVDALYLQVYRELLTLMMSNPANIDQASYLTWAAHNLERAADRVTNICERVVFTVTGEMAEMDSQESDSHGPQSLG
jgi:phosphate transport system protein